MLSFKSLLINLSSNFFSKLWCIYQFLSSYFSQCLLRSIKYGSFVFSLIQISIRNKYHSLLINVRMSVQFSSVQSLSHVWLSVTPWIAACQASLSITNSWSSPRLTSIESVMQSSHLILCRPLLLLPPNPSQHQSLFQWVNSSHHVAKVLEFQL